MVVAEDLADHVDLNFGCPVPKVTRKGGGAALPWHRKLFASIVQQPSPRPTGRSRSPSSSARASTTTTSPISRPAGARRTPAPPGSRCTRGPPSSCTPGTADWAAIARLKDAADVPVLGNGDLWTGKDALRMVAATGADGVVVGRGCLGRPWLFGELAAAFAGEPAPTPPDLAEVARIMRRHVELLVEAFDGDEVKACRDFRKHVAWYLKGFPVGGETRAALGMVVEPGRARRTPRAPRCRRAVPVGVAALPRGRTSAQRRVALPDGWLDDPDTEVVPEGAELADSGG